MGTGMGETEIDLKFIIIDKSCEIFKVRNR